MAQVLEGILIESEWLIGFEKLMHVTQPHTSEKKNLRGLPKINDLFIWKFLKRGFCVRKNMTHLFSLDYLMLCNSVQHKIGSGVIFAVKRILESVYRGSSKKYFLTLKYRLRKGNGQKFKTNGTFVIQIHQFVKLAVSLAKRWRFRQYSWNKAHA